MRAASSSSSGPRSKSSSTYGAAIAEAPGPVPLGGRVGGLHHGVELLRVAALLARPVAGALAASERHVVVDASGRQVDHHHAGLGAALEVARVLQRGGDDA